MILWTFRCAIPRVYCEGVNREKIRASTRAGVGLFMEAVDHATERRKRVEAVACAITVKHQNGSSPRPNFATKRWTSPRSA